MNKVTPLRQRTRKALLILSALLFPIFMNFLSPYVIIDGASQGILNGSFVTFCLMFAGALFFGRLWCGWACPAGGFGEIAFLVNDQPARGGRLNWIKWFVWVPWILIIIGMVISAGGYRAINLLLDTENGISVAGSADRPILFAYIIYYLVIGSFMLLSVFAGRRAGCHYICWMAPFMILGRKLGSLLHIPALQLAVDSAACKDCKKCSTNCPMSLDVNSMVRLGRFVGSERSECILCGTCIDNCPNHVLRYAFH